MDAQDKLKNVTLSSAPCPICQEAGELGRLPQEIYGMDLDKVEPYLRKLYAARTAGGTK